MRHYVKKTSPFLLCILALLFMDGCRKDFSATAEHKASYGWEMYELKDYLKSKEWTTEGKLSGNYCSTHAKLSDLFTKNLSPSKFNLLGDQITGYAYFPGTVTKKLFYN